MKLLTASEAAKELGKTAGRIRQLISDGKMKAEKKGRDWLIDSKEVERAKKRPHQRNRTPKG